MATPIRKYGKGPGFLAPGMKYSIHGGIQQIIDSKQTRAFNVMGVSHSRKEFAHCWKPKQ